jgi:hypothetical protein
MLINKLLQPVIVSNAVKLYQYILKLYGVLSYSIVE